MISGKLISDDPFWDVKAQEHELRFQLDLRIRRLQGDIGIAEKAMALRNAPGFQDYLKLLQARLALASDELIAEDDERRAAILQGQVRGMRAVFGLLRETEQGVALRRQELQDLIQERERRFIGEKVRPIGATS